MTHYGNTSYTDDFALVVSFDSLSLLAGVYYTQRLWLLFFSSCASTLRFSAHLWPDFLPYVSFALSFSSAVLTITPIVAVATTLYRTVVRNVERSFQFHIKIVCVCFVSVFRTADMDVFFFPFPLSAAFASVHSIPLRPYIQNAAPQMYSICDYSFIWLVFVEMIMQY